MYFVSLLLEILASLPASGEDLVIVSIVRKLSVCINQPSLQMMTKSGISRNQFIIPQIMKDCLRFEHRHCPKQDFPFHSKDCCVRRLVDSQTARLMKMITFIKLNSRADVVCWNLSQIYFQVPNCCLRDDTDTQSTYLPEAGGAVGRTLHMA